MSYWIEQSQAASDGTLRIEIAGKVPIADLDRLRREVARRARDTGTKRLLVDVRNLVHEVGPVETLRLVESYAEEKPCWKTAVLETQEQAAANQFHETVALNRGFQVLHFTDQAKALGWLSA